MRILITGGAGFIGSNLTEYVNTRSPNSEITILDDLSSGSLENLEKCQAEFVKGSVLDESLVSELVAGCDSIVHLAAIGSVPRSITTPRLSHDVNVNGTINLLEAARNAKVENVIFASSSSVYGANPDLPKDELSWTLPMSPYAASKLAGEGYMSAYATSFGVPTLSFRFFNVYGPKQTADHVYAAVIPRFISAFLRDEPIQIYGDGTQSRDFTFVEDVCSVIWEALEQKKLVNHPVNLAAGTSVSLNELVSRLQTLIGKDPVIEYATPRKGDVQHSSASTVLFNKTFPDAKFSSLDAGLDMTIDWNRAKFQK